MKAEIFQKDINSHGGRIQNSSSPWEKGEKITTEKSHLLLASLLFFFIFHLFRPPLAEAGGAQIFPYRTVLEKMDQGENAPFPLSKVKGKPFVMLLFTTSMPDCRESVLKFTKLSQKFPGGNVAFLAVDISPERMRRTLPLDREEWENVTFLTDPDREIARVLSIQLIPTTLIVSGDGIIRDIIASRTDWNSPYFKEKIESLTNK